MTDSQAIHPALTIVVPSVNGLHDLVPCCEALRRARPRAAGRAGRGPTGWRGGRHRAAPPSLLARLATGAAALALPPLLLLRITRSLLSKQVQVGRVLTTMPFIGAFVLSWGLGGVVGYWTGAGDALSRVR